MIDMVGIGPFVVMPLVVSYLHNGLFLWAWIFGAFTAFIDATIWSELGAKYPLAGGTYNFHRIAFGEKGGRLMSFAQYLSYIVDLNFIQQKLVSGGLVLIICFLLYRKIETVGKISVVLWVV